MQTPRRRAAVPALIGASSLVLLTAWGAQTAPNPPAVVTPPTAQLNLPSAVERTAPAGEPWVVSLGDSYISGEAGRWAGNESLLSRHVDALGEAAYWDGGSGERIERCHRSSSAAIHIGVVRSLNLACSSAVTGSMTKRGYFKPGIDFYRDGDRKGQALMLQEFAEERNVKMVALSIGGNDFHFSDIIKECVKGFLVPVASVKCRDDSDVQSYTSDAAAAKVRRDTAGAILNIAKAMENAGYSDVDWTLVLQLYPEPLAGSGSMRYSSFGYTRHTIGGCGFRDADLDWALGTLLPLVNKTFREGADDARAQRPSLQIEVMDATRAFRQRELCHDSVDRVGGENGPRSWTDPGAVDRSEWVMDINVVNVGDTYKQESLHPNYWGQLALRNCWRQVWNGGDVRGGKCERDDTGGLTADCEPRMTLAPYGSRAGRAALPRETGQVEVSLRCPGITIAAGETAVLRGRVRGADPDTRVTLQVRLDGRSWRDEGRKALRSDGDYRFTMAIPQRAPAGRVYEWRVAITSGGGVIAVSQTRTTRVR